MFEALRSQALLQRKAGEIYGAIVTQARHPDFYAKLGVPDTPAGRYEVVVIHLFLVLERLRARGHQELSRRLIEAFVADMDDVARELGTGDVAVARKVRRAAAGLYERSRDYRDALVGADPDALAATIARHLPAGAGAVTPCAGRLSDYIRAASAALQRVDASDDERSRPVFPAPLGFSEHE